LLVYRWKGGTVEVFLAHPGGPFWKSKDLGSWTIPKGLVTPGEDPFDAAEREFREETGFDIPSGRIVALRPLKQPSGKVVHAWAVEGDFDPTRLASNSFYIEWPPGSGKELQFPEIDRGEWFNLETARKRILKGQAGFLDELSHILSDRKIYP
jgi:predicted NUDIX family NTP pyrophosphohydrolase